MSQAETRERAAAGPSETDIAFAKAVRTRRTGVDKEQAPEVAPETPRTTGDESSEMAALRAELAQLRSIVMSKQAPTSARRAGEVADAELAAEACSAELAMVIADAKPRAKEGRDRELIYTPEDREKIDEMRVKLTDLNQKVDIARALAGEIPRTHPGLKRLPPDHPVFRAR